MEKPIEARLADILELLVPDPAVCKNRAEELKKKYPKLSNAALARKVVSQAKVWTAFAGGASGVVTNPAIMFPAAIGETGYTLRAEGIMAGIIAAIYEPETLDDYDTFKTDIIAIIFPGAIGQAVNKVAIQAGKATTKTVIRQYISKDVLRTVIKLAAKYLGVKVTQRAIITKSVPLVGGVIGASWNWIEVQAVGKRAIKYYNEEPIA